MVIQRRIEYSLLILFLEILSFIYGLLYIYEGFKNFWLQDDTEDYLILLLKDVKT